MFKFLSGAAPAPTKAEPTALLKLVAGAFAADVARLWPDPHTAFFTATSARRHLVCVAFALGRDVAAVADAVLRGRLRDAIGVVLDRSPPGLERALGRLGETAWSAEAYRRLVELLAEPRAAKLLRHAEAIDADAVARLGRLPPPMSGALALEIGRASCRERV